MKKTLSNLKQVNHFIQETEESIKAVKANKSLHEKEKAEKLREYNTHLNKLKETKYTVLENLQREVKFELLELQQFLND